VAGLPATYTVPDGTLPLLGGVLSMMHFAHRNMCQLIRDLPAEALVWSPSPSMGTLAGILEHAMYCEAYAYRLVAGEAVAWNADANVRTWESTADTDRALAAIVEADAVMKRILPTMTVARMGERFPAWGNDDPESGGALIAEAAAHTAMHWGHMQMTRQLWEQAHPEFVGIYRPW